MSVVSKWLNGLFQKDQKKQFEQLILQAATLFLGKVAKDAQDLAKKWVVAAEATQMTGPDKLKFAYDGIVKELQGISIPQYLLHIFIESAVGTLT